MNKRVKKKWIKALGSGNYIKGQGYLWMEDKDEYCCLGVLTDLYIREKKIKNEDRMHDLLDRAVLHDEVMAWAEIEDDNGHMRDSNSLTAINDEFEDKRSFGPVIKAIKEHF